MDNYKIIHFESNQIRIRKITDTLFMPNAKFWNKLYELCNGYVKAENYLKSGPAMECSGGARGLLP